MQFARMTQANQSGVAAFNARIAHHPSRLLFGTVQSSHDDSQPPQPQERRRYLAYDEEGTIRGGYLLQWQKAWLRGRMIDAASLGSPVSEGIIDPRFRALGAALLRDAAKRCPNLYALGTGGRNSGYFRLAKAMRWADADIPFLFHILRPTQFLRHAKPLRERPSLRALSSVAASTGLGQLAINIVQARGRLAIGEKYRVELVEDIAEAADEVWDRARSAIDFCMVRDGAHVTPMFPNSHKGLNRLVVRYQGTIVGWAVVTTTGLARVGKFLGECRPGLIVDTFGDLAHAPAIARAARDWLADMNADVALTNTSHSAWLSAFRQAGFLNYPSQYPLIASGEMSKLPGGLSNAIARAHVTRADGDGVHYLIDNEDE